MVSSILIKQRVDNTKSVKIEVSFGNFNKTNLAYGPDALSPFYLSKENQDPLIAELVRIGGILGSQTCSGNEATALNCTQDSTDRRD